MTLQGALIGGVAGAWFAYEKDKADHAGGFIIALAGVPLIAMGAVAGYVISDLIF